MNTFQQHRVQNQIKTYTGVRVRVRLRVRSATGTNIGQDRRAAHAPVSSGRLVVAAGGFRECRFQVAAGWVSVKLVSRLPGTASKQVGFGLRQARSWGGLQFFARFSLPSCFWQLALGWVSTRPTALLHSPSGGCQLALGVGFSSPSGWFKLALGRVSLRHRVGVNSPSGGCQLAFVSCAVRPWGGL